MDKVQEAVFFLGANSPKGFYGVFSELQKPHMRQLYILKGCPGNGKSTYLRKIAQAALHVGFFVEHIVCASDPGSLDGIYIPEKGFAWVDGTNPHAMETVLAGVQDSYVNLGSLLAPDGVTAHKEELSALYASYRRAQNSVGRFMRALGELYEAIVHIPQEIPTEKLVRRTKNIIA